ncbi:ABC transporter ATP-binding protein [Rhizobium indigoferae]|uniref:Sn-glycerol-3-phosphate ABC transporter ATP-binding protein UgpC n=1 Tax=Rhizobium indigoferae TaxID=158891 RepID=A0ABZ1DU62_9HYPH|nr:sn-glycerol-3-phosphate ABC transporter ATP-binding protein UgpC [Rhizobium indigoferae]NNU52535.1 sn-glycerol-3-phosphate ABC transporter ATP-binding protein UgpC [Rhizobium indigoferae]WRW39304.1 sn-glycerol-3-phosphate ABC transporter ATP-binding protein UgpC [Rhizobium indigoferae]GLR55850.1 ABC transporter ATP-binding protein [Rhizobium indigoferae]
MASIALHNIRKSYGNLPVIHGVDVDIQDGEFIVLVGPSGCGKSTLLRMIAGLETISGGRLSIGGRMVNDLPSKERDIAMVFQSYALYPHLTVAENMGFSLKLRGTAKDEIGHRVQSAAKTLALEPYLDRLPRLLSGGQRQRVAMGRAIVRDAKVFLFDEPLSNLDAKLRVAMRAEIKELHQRLKITTVYVTHDQTEAMTMADRIVVMRDGIVEQIGTPLEIYDRPATTFVAGFIGMPAMNLLRGRIQADAPSIFRTESGVAMPLSLSPGTADPGEELIYGIRPEQFVIADEGTPAKVVVVEPTGADTQVVARIGEENVNMLFRERIAVRPGNTIRFALRAASDHLFSVATGRRLSIAGA